jgi:hypothetical protein
MTTADVASQAQRARAGGTLNNARLLVVQVVVYQIKNTPVVLTLKLNACGFRVCGHLRLLMLDKAIELENGLPASLGDLDQSYQVDIFFLDAGAVTDPPRWVAAIDLCCFLPHG